PAEALDGVDLLVTSPGVPAEAPLLAEARRRGIAVATEVEFAWRHRPEAPLAAVTGSNGKSTVTSLIAEMLRAQGVAVAAGGNLGPPASELVLEGGWEAWVLEISSFQAELLTAMAPRAAVLLNLSQDHLERHPDMASYLAAKLRLFAHQGADDTAVLNADDPAVAGAAVRARRRLFSLEAPADASSDGRTLFLDGEPLMEVSRLALAGRHNVANALAAALAARALGAERDAIVRALESFRGLPHRHVLVAERDGVRFVDDSKATNVGATLAALGGYRDRSVLLILGGLAKGQDFSPLVPAVRRAVRTVYLIGRDAARIEAALGGAAPVERCGTLDVAVERARRDARRGDTVLLAPACASFDQFSGYAERGDTFAALVTGKEVAPCR
ncbi:MAG TPA: UDP-N-acetylmuramoyl-L-alanine--D-glutamate ligase, partial [Acidobacteria bacterium]|nr:UDP-N-acetylmuramoyl-L-alanine--D-glutamate ligase [Acidobacteriota bacterium]